MFRLSFFGSYGTFNRDFLKNVKPDRLIETVRLLPIYVKVGLFNGKMTEYLVKSLI